MKKFAALFICIVMIFALASCGSKTETADTTVPESVNAVNPITEYSSLEELNNITGGNLCHPPVMGVTDEAFRTINVNNGEYTIAEYEFSVNGKPYNMRFSPNYTEDISGYYSGEGTVFANSENEAIVKTDDAALARWVNTDGQYVLCVKGTDIEDEWFQGIVDELKGLTVRGYSQEELVAKYDELAGNYQDSVSQRATAEIESLKEDGVKIVVSWAEGASVVNTWTMTAKIYEDGLLSYSDCEYAVTDYSNSEEGEKEVQASGGEGFFTIQEDGGLHWSGAQDEQCRECLFEKV